jgi:hypothetical protein
MKKKEIQSVFRWKTTKLQRGCNGTTTEDSGHSREALGAEEDFTTEITGHAEHKAAMRMGVYPTPVVFAKEFGSS